MITLHTEPHLPSAEDRARLGQIISRAQEVIAPCWPLKTFAYYNPLRDLEYLPFDQAVQHGQAVLGGKGYLTNEEFRQLYRKGRMTDAAITRALKQVLPGNLPGDVVGMGKRHISSLDVLRVHLLFGVDALPHRLWSWTLHHDQAFSRFRPDLPSESQQRILERTIRECESCRDNPERTYVDNLWRSVLTALDLRDPAWTETTDANRDGGESEERVSEKISLPAHHTLSEWVGRLTGVGLIEQINEQMIKWVSAFLDEGLGNWEMPVRQEGFYATWKSLGAHDFTGQLLGIKQFRQKVQQLSSHPEETVVEALHTLEIPEDRWQEYLSRHLAYLSGWAGFIRWRSENPFYSPLHQGPIDPLQYLAVRLFYEKELVRVACRQEWGIEGTLSEIIAHCQDRPDLVPEPMARQASEPDPLWCHDAWRLFHLAQFLEFSPLEVQEFLLSDARTLLGWLDSFPPEAHGPVWLAAYEDAYQQELLGRLAGHRRSVPAPEGRPLAQMIFCIDARSEPFRRHLEAQGPYETLGYAGFFGIPVNHAAFDSHDHLALCPILLTPQHEVWETPRPGQADRLAHYLSGTRWQQLAHHVFHDLKYNPIGSFMLIDVLGPLFSLGLVGKTLSRNLYHRLKSVWQRGLFHPVATEMVVERPVATPPPAKETSTQRFLQGFSLEEQAAFIEAGLRITGLTKNFGRLVVTCGHGSSTENNPYFSAYDCGACGGSHGDPNARVFAEMGNHPDVRRILKAHGILIPDDTWFLAAKHDTTTDRVTFYDVEVMPSTHTPDLQQLTLDLERAGTHQALERCQRIPQAPAGLSPKQAFAHVQTRSVDWANPRPEWGLSGNAAFLIGRRALTNGLDLKSRVFLHSYDPAPDDDGALLEKIMTAPLIVGELISLTYYFSAVAPWVYGCGSKVLHNVVSGVGVMLGSQSDLQRGLPLQSVNDGGTLYHEPMRLLAMIEAPSTRISGIIQKHVLLQNLFHHRWMNLVAIDPVTGGYQRYDSDGSWNPLAIQAGEVAEQVLGR